MFSQPSSAPMKLIQFVMEYLGLSSWLNADSLIGYFTDAITGLHSDYGTIGLLVRFLAFLFVFWLARKLIHWAFSIALALGVFILVMKFF